MLTSSIIFAEKEIIERRETAMSIHGRISDIDGNTSGFVNPIGGFDAEITGIPPKDGKSAYEIAVEHGFVGTEEEWLESLKGRDGAVSIINEDGEMTANDLALLRPNAYFLKKPVTISYRYNGIDYQKSIDGIVEVQQSDAYDKLFVNDGNVYGRFYAPTSNFLFSESSDKFGILEAKKYGLDGSTGSNGQILTRTSNGAEWKDMQYDAVQSDWNVNDAFSDSFVRNRPFYTEPNGTVHKIPAQYYDQPTKYSDLMADIDYMMPNFVSMVQGDSEYVSPATLFAMVTSGEQVVAKAKFEENGDYFLLWNFAKTEYDIIAYSTFIREENGVFTYDTVYIAGDVMSSVWKTPYLQKDSGELRIPVNVSELNNDAGYLTSEDVPLENYYTKEETDELIPVNVSELNNDAGYLTQHQSLENYYTKAQTDSKIPVRLGQLSNDVGYVTSSAIPTKVSQLKNDSGFITQHQSLENYYTKAQTDTKVQGAISLIPTKTSQLTNDSGFVTNVPTKVSDLTNDLEFQTFSQVNANITGRGYATVSQLPTKTSQLVNDSGFLTQHQSLANYYTKQQVNNLIPQDVSELNNDAGYITSTSLAPYALITQLPTRTNQLINDSGFLTQHQSLSAYAKLTDLPTKLSQLQNDTSYITSDYLPTKVSDLVNDAGYITASDIPESEVIDVRVNNASVVSGGIANVPKASSGVLGVVSIGSGVSVNTSGAIRIDPATESDITDKTDNYKPITPYVLDYAVKKALADSSTTWSSSDKASAKACIGAQNLSDFVNDEGFITNADLPTKVSDLTNDAEYQTLAEVNANISGRGYATVSQLPTKVSDLVNDEGFITDADIPTKTSDLTNDSGFITISSVPTKTSELTNDSGFLTQHQSLAGYATETWVTGKGYQTAVQVQAIIDANIETVTDAEYNAIFG